MTLPAPQIDQDTPITSEEQLLAFFRRGIRPSEQWGIGVEVEQVVVDAVTGEAADYPRIEALLKALAVAGQWSPQFENGHVISLQGENSSITLEPGGQIEHSGRLCTNLACNYKEFVQYSTEMFREADTLGLLLLGLGTQPFTPLEQINWIPKDRYQIMGPYMSRRGSHGQRMMKQSAGLQVNLDYCDEADCMLKLSLAQALAPLLYALFANSPFLDGQPTGVLSTRGQIWENTDADRTGLLPFLFNPGAGFRDYMEHALDVPMYFIVREGQHLDLTTERFTFRKFLEQGFASHFATEADWNLHLSTLFTEARLRPQIEIRSPDSLPPDMALMVAGLLKGIFYDSQSLDAAWNLCQPASIDELRDTCRAAWTHGLRAPWRNRTLKELAADCLELGRNGLARQSCQWARSLNEAIFLDGLEQIITSGQTLAERLLEQWHGTRQEKLAILTRHCALTGSLALPETIPCAYAQFDNVK